MPPGLMPHSRTDHQHVCARIRRAAGFATSTGSAGHAGTTASSRLTFHPVHSMKAGQSAPSSAPEGANHQWRKIPPGELSIDPEAGERLGRVTGRVGASLQRSPWGG